MNGRLCTCSASGPSEILDRVKPFKCSLCEYATRSKSNLKAHMNRHSTEKTHLCDMCGKKFKSKGTLKSHKLLHTADVMPRLRDAAAPGARRVWRVPGPLG
ncbi:hypothetical protein Celaphus_00016181 [Cervus elaphus hippelaphus]|uniref:C2H2-type domain-containing protein n=1 Tax=Cervus elaphus hippelaphus TaxID=46360 RepID=A0A212CE48_CEREH|nr:hypothetical protein Celaphus_00016181 [Cervus elaphus hippelaphus]